MSESEYDSVEDNRSLKRRKVEQKKHSCPAWIQAMYRDDNENLGYLAVIKKRIPRHFGDGISVYQAFYSSNFEQVLQNVSFEARVQSSSMYPIEVRVKTVKPEDHHRLQLIPDWFRSGNGLSPSLYFDRLPRSQCSFYKETYYDLVEEMFQSKGTSMGYFVWGDLEKKMQTDYPQMFDILCTLTVKHPPKSYCKDFLIRTDSPFMNEGDVQVFGNADLPSLVKDVRTFARYFAYAAR